MKNIILRIEFEKGKKYNFVAKYIYPFENKKKNELKKETLRCKKDYGV
jgi:hypothetical protein